MTKIAITALNAEGNPYSFGEVVVRLVDAGSGGAIDGGVIVAPRPVRLDEDGEAQVDLTPTAEVDPAGTCYAFTVVGVAPTVVRYLEVPSPNIVGPSEVPYPWNDPDLQVVFAEPPTFVPAPSTGTVGEVLTLVDDGDGKRYELRPPTGATTDAELDVTAAALTFKAASVADAYEEAADLLGVSPSIKATTAGALGVLITEPGDTQDEVNENASNVARLAMAIGDRGRTDAARAQGSTDLAVGLSQVVGDMAYLKVGHDNVGSPTHAEGAFECDTDLQFPDGFDGRVWGRLMHVPGVSKFPEWVTRNVDGGFGSVDAYELAPWCDDDGDLRWFAEHIKVGETVELNPRLVADKGLAQNPAMGVICGIRHTIDYTGGPGGVGVERFWVPSANPDVVTADGVGWVQIAEVVHAGPESMNLGYTDPWMLGMSEHESHLFVVQMFNGIDGTCLVDLHAADATSATSVTCRQGTTWTAAGTQGEIVNYQTSGTDASALSTGTVPFARLPIGTTSTTVPAGNDSRFSDARTPTAHASSHASAGSDPLTIAQSQVTNLATDLAAKVPSTRTIAGLDLSTDRTAAALRTALGLWTPIANETLGSASGSRTYDITGYRFVRITMAARSNRNGTIDTIRLRFNGDTSSNYSTNTGSFTTFISAFDISGENTNTDRSGYVVVQFAYMAGAWLTGTAMGTGPSSTATTAANSLSTGFAWKGATSAAPTSIEVYTAIGQFVAGSSFLVEGRP